MSTRKPEAVYVRNEFTAIILQDEEWYVAFCLEISAANGQGKTREDQCFGELGRGDTAVF